VHEIKHDGYRMMARRDAAGIRLLTRNGYDWAQKYPLIVEAVNHLRVRSCLIDGDAVCGNEDGLAVFAKMRAGGERTGVCSSTRSTCLLELDGKDMRREPFEVRKATLASVLRQGRPALRINEHLDYPGDLVFRTRVQDGLGRHRVEASGIELPIRAIAGLVEV
jgi:bifunctional non-homologous end joining protein LigD